VSSSFKAVIFDAWFELDVDEDAAQRLRLGIVGGAPSGTGPNQ